jgi:hypothetical protein
VTRESSTTLGVTVLIRSSSSGAATSAISTQSVTNIVENPSFVTDVSVSFATVAPELTSVVTIVAVGAVREELVMLLAPSPPPPTPPPSPPPPDSPAITISSSSQGAIDRGGGGIVSASGANDDPGLVYALTMATIAVIMVLICCPLMFYVSVVHLRRMRAGAKINPKSLTSVVHQMPPEDTTDLGLDADLNAARPETPGDNGTGVGALVLPGTGVRGRMMAPVESPRVYGGAASPRGRVTLTL